MNCPPQPGSTSLKSNKLVRRFKFLSSGWINDGASRSCTSDLIPKVELPLAPAVFASNQAPRKIRQSSDLKLKPDDRESKRESDSRRTRGQLLERLFGRQ